MGGTDVAPFFVTGRIRVTMVGPVVCPSSHLSSPTWTRGIGLDRDPHVAVMGPDVLGQLLLPPGWRPEERAERVLPLAELESPGLGLRGAALLPLLAVRPQQDGLRHARGVGAGEVHGDSRGLSLQPMEREAREVGDGRL